MAVLLLASCSPDDSGSATSDTTISGLATDDEPNRLEDALERIEQLEMQLEELESELRRSDTGREVAEAERDMAKSALAEIEGTSCSQLQADPGQGEMIVILYQICDQRMAGSSRILAGLQPVGRVVLAEEDALLAALKALLSGSTPEETALGYRSFFSPATSEALLSADIGDGTAVVDLDRAIIESLNSVGTSTASKYFRGQLYGTVFTNAGVDAAEFRLDGDNIRFCALMELVLDCTPITRTDWNRSYASTSDN